jgi:hypothetical protein
MKMINRIWVYFLTMLSLIFILVSGCKKEEKETGIKIGDSYQGGIIFWILQPGQSGYDSKVKHGLIAAPSDQSTGSKWSNGTYIITGTTAWELGTGNANTNTIVSVQGEGNYAAKLCYDLVLNGYDDWYLPSDNELQFLCLFIQSSSPPSSRINYWSSSEINTNPQNTASVCYIIAKNSSGAFAGDKNQSYHVRAVRSF